MPWPEMTRRSALLASASSISIMPSAASSTPTPSSVGHFSSKALRRLLDVQLDLAAEEIVRIEPAEDGIAIGDGRFGAAAWSKQIGPGSEPALSGPRPLSWSAGSTFRIMPAPAPMVSRCSVGTLSLKRSIIGSFSMRVWPRVMHTHVEGGATHVRADQRIVADQLADIGRTQNAADRAGNHGLVQARMVDRGQAAEGEQRLARHT